MGGPVPLDEQVRARMRAQATSRTAPERALLAEVRRLGFRPGVDRPLPLGGVRRRADLSWKGARVAVFVDGCFWHGCPEHRRPVVHNAQWWMAKIRRNVLRDRETTAMLTRAGWTVLRFWEHEDPVAAAAAVGEVLRAGRHGQRG